MFLGNVRTYEIIADLFIRSTITVVIKTISYCHMGWSTILNNQQKVILVAVYDVFLVDRNFALRKDVYQVKVFFAL